MSNQNYLTHDQIDRETSSYNVASNFIDKLCVIARTSDEGVGAGNFHGNFVSAYTTPKNQLRVRFGFGRGKSLTVAAALAHLEYVEIQTRLAKFKEERTVHCVAKVTYCEGHAPTVSLNGTRDLHLAGTFFYFGVGAVARGQSGRKECDGPVVEGPWAYAFGLSTALTESSAIREKDAARRAEALEVSDGSLIWVDGIEYRVTVERREFIKLVETGGAA